MDDRQLIELIEQAYRQRNVKYVRDRELLEWLKQNGLTQEEAKKSIYTATRQRVIRFCYPTSVGGKELVPCYEKLTEEDLEFEKDVDEHLLKKMQLRGKLKSDHARKEVTKRTFDNESIKRERTVDTNGDKLN
nr:hypothetical protein [Candidatus Njordarchaeota archaeon]